MEAVTDVVFRHVVAQAGAPDVWFTEFTNATGWAHAGDRAIGGRLIKTDDEHPIVAQLWGSDPASMEKLAAHCAELGYDGIDINMGCPDSSAVKSGGGSGMILNPENAAAIVAAAKTSGLPVSVKTRLGYSHIDEWHDWITHILQQDIVNFTIHLRTKKEMSKVPAHYELIADIKKLRDDIAPQTLLTINGDIRDRAHGLELVEQYGVDGIMIGRGIFANPFAFAPLLSEPLPSFDFAEAKSARRSLATGPVGESAPKTFQTTEKVLGAAPLAATRAGETAGEPLATKSSETSAARVPAAAYATGTRREAVSGDFGGEEANAIQNVIDLYSGVGNSNPQKRLNLLRLQLDLYDQYHTQTGRPFETLKRFFKIYIRDFAGASELRDRLMHAKTTDEVRGLLADHSRSL